MTNDDTISRQAAIDAVNQYNFDFPQYMERFATELRDAMKADLKHDIEALPSTQPEVAKDTNVPINDCINRQAAVDAFWKLDAEIRPSAIDAILNMLKGLPSAQPDLQPTCNQLATDVISRQAAIDAIEEMQKPIMRSKFSEEQFVFTGMSEALRAIKDLPSAQPEIIRCKDCKYCDRGIDEDGNPFLKCLGWVYGGTQEEDFCSHAERRTDE